MQTPTKPVSEAAILAPHELNLAAPTADQLRPPRTAFSLRTEARSAFLSAAWDALEARQRHGDASPEYQAARTRTDAARESFLSYPTVAP